MIIKRLSASFGKLSNSTLLLKNGLNIIEAPNESGKSTWCAFIRTMLYGIHTSDRDKAGYLSDKTRYRPWNGTAMEGSMEVEANGVLVTIQRTASGRFPMKDFSAHYTGTSQVYAALSPETAGETLTGVSEAVFERSAFIAQCGIKVCQTPELEKRISALVSTGDETISYSEADERLRSWLRKRRHNKSGTIPAQESRLQAVSEKINGIEALNEKAAEIRQELERLEQRKAHLTERLREADQQQARQTLNRALVKLSEAKAVCDRLEAEIIKNGPAPTGDEIAWMRGEISALKSLQAILDGDLKRKGQAEIEVQAAMRVKESAVSDLYNPGVLEEAAALEREAAKNSCRGAATVVLIAIMAVSIIASVMFTGAARTVSITSGAVFALLLVWRIIVAARTKNKLQKLLSGFGSSSVSDLRRAFESNIVILRNLEQAENELASAEITAEASANRYQTRYEQLDRRLRSFSIEARDLSIAENELSRIEAIRKKLDAAKADYSAAEQVYAALSEETPDVTVDSALEPSLVGEAELPQLKDDLKVVSGQLHGLTARYHMMLGEIRALGDPVVLGSEKASCETALFEQKMQYDALALAIETLGGASAELQTRFSPLLSDMAGRICSRLTGGRYEKLTFDKELAASAKTADESVSRNILTLSAGTADQVYLALRLAVIDLILPKADPCPLIFDDALANFDDGRAALALDYLLELSESRQILLFTCHGREADYFTNNSNVHITRL
jgi:uncharacterized coiled-coil protein SlyX